MEAFRYRGSRRVPDQKRRRDALSAGRNLDVGRDQLRRLPAAAQPRAGRARAVSFDLRRHTRALFLSRRFADGPQDLVPFFTMMFLHGGWLHLILNMWTL
jgi:hypothetical protein